MLSSDITDVKGIGRKKAELLLTEAGIKDIEDLLYFIPRRYIDRSSFKSITDCFVNETVSVRGIIKKSSVVGKGRKRLEVVIDDGSDSLIGIFFSAIPYFTKIFAAGEEVIFSGKIGFYRTKQIVHPDFDFIDKDDASGLSLLNTGRLIPLYKSTEKLKAAGLDSKGLRRIIRNAIEAHIGDITDTLSADIIERQGLMRLPAALRAIHFPESLEQAEAARKRLVFNEMFFLMFYLAVSKRYTSIRYSEAPPEYDTELYDAFTASLPFSLTVDQLRALDEIKADLSAPVPMNRLLQGDVGNGKTIVALASALLPIGVGRQAAFMVPTEVLAKQHFETITRLLPKTIKPLLLTGGMNTGERDAAYKALAEGGADIAVGTHALLQSGVKFKDLAYIIIDEQHRFGVEQRSLLRQKGDNTDFLIMTATPIPRSLAMTLFGDLDISTIKSRPAERKPVQTLAFPVSRIGGVYNSMEKYINQGRQIFYVLPVIETSEKTDLKSAEAVYENLSKNVFRNRRIALLHGRLKEKEKNSIMTTFASGETDILVATTVIEVGIDVPNASVIVIEHPERFGLSQLHQLRGRVGRGCYQSFCVLIYPDDISAESKRRIDVMLSTDDGFIIAEEDLKLRGSGELTGLKQHGASEFEFTDLSRDANIIAAAKAEANSEAEKISDEEIEKAVSSLNAGAGSLSPIHGIRSKRMLEIMS